MRGWNVQEQPEHEGDAEEESISSVQCKLDAATTQVSSCPKLEASYEEASRRWSPS